MLTPAQIQLVKNSWKILLPTAQEMGLAFYVRLFETAPQLRPLFKTNPRDQAMKLMYMLSYLVNRLDNLQALQEEVVRLAQRHSGYGAKKEHYHFIGDTLMWSLEKNLGKDWTPETKEAWMLTYAFISDLMIGAQAAENEKPAPH